jgi:hypothetical protein
LVTGAGFDLPSLGADRAATKARMAAKAASAARPRSENPPGRLGTGAAA